MAIIQTDILGQVLFFYDLQPICIIHPEETPLRVRISSDRSGILLDEVYWPDFAGQINIDIRDIVAHELSHTIPSVEGDIQQSSLFQVFHLSVGDDEIAGDFTVNGMSSDSTDKITDVDFLRVPSDYVLPLSLFNQCERNGIRFVLPDESVTIDGLETLPSGVGATSRMIFIQDSPAAAARRFKIELDCGDKILSSAQFEMANGNFEQYLFANRYGGFDNIPMDGVLEFLPAMSFESGDYSDRSEQIDSDSEYIYTQNSGYQSRRVIELASEFMCCSQIYHRGKDGEFRRIVIQESDISSRSKDTLHSFSFKFKYADDSRPLSLKGKSVLKVGAAEPEKTLVRVLAQSPQTITHGKNRVPHVVVVDANNQVIDVMVEYPDMNNVVLSWNGELSGYIYIN